MDADSSTNVITVKLRVSPELKQKIAESAEKYNRSMNADMVARLEESFLPNLTGQDIPPELEMMIKNILITFNKLQKEKDSLESS